MMARFKFSFVLYALISRRTLFFAVGMLLVLGAFSTLLDQRLLAQSDSTQSLSFTAIYRSIIAAYLIAAVHWVIDLTPKLIYQLRPVIKIDNEEFDRRAKRVIGRRLNLLLKLLAPIFVLIWMIAVILRLLIGGETGATWQVSLTEPLLPLTEVGFSLFAVWRMAQFARLSHQPLEINLFDTRPLYPFGQLSFAYAAIISVRMLIQIATSGFVEGPMAVIFTISSIASLLALLLPIWSVHRQLLTEKLTLLQPLNEEMNRIARTLLDHAADEHQHLEIVARSMQTIHTIREQIANVWSWPVPNSVTAIQVLLLSTAPTLLNLLKTYILPLINTLSTK